MTPWQLTACEGVAQIQAGRLSAVEWVRSCLERIGSLEPKLHAWAFLDPAIPLSQAEHLDRLRAGRESASPLDSVPIGVKDIFNTLEMPTEMGSALWKGFTPGNDARVVAALKRRGGIVMGKTVTSEFAVHFPGPTRNPHDLERSPGTSSSGSAAAVAAGMVPLALGSQTAGSTIRPASYCGLYGFKPSFGLLPRTGMLKTTDTLDHVSLFARSASDLRLLFDQARVRGSNHPFVHREVDPAEHRPEPAWRVGLVRGPFWDQAQPHVRASVEAFARECGTMAATRVEAFTMPEEAARVHASHQKIYCAALAYYFEKEGRSPERLSPSFREMLEAGKGITPQEVRRELEFQAEFTRRMDRCFEESGCDFLLDFSTAAEAPLGLEKPDPPDHCLIWTFAGLPALSVPMFKAPSGLPLGLQLVGRKYGDYTLLRFASHLTQTGAARPVRIAQPMEETGVGVG